VLTGYSVRLQPVKKMNNKIIIIIFKLIHKYVINIIFAYLVKIALILKEIFGKTIEPYKISDFSVHVV